MFVLAGGFLFQGLFSGSFALVSAENFPKKNIRWVVPYAPGGGYDLYSRAIAGTMKKYLPKGINIIIMNKPGAGGQIATSYIYNAKPDGYTIGILPMPGLFVPQMFFKTSYDMNKITWLGTVLNEPLVFAVAASSKLKTLQDVRQAEIVRICGTGFTGTEIAIPITMETMGIKAKYITGHRGSKDAILAAMRGDGDATMFSYGTTRKHVLNKRFKAMFLIGTDKRIPEVPDVPTAVELGYPNLGLLSGWRVVGATPDLPQDRYTYLSDLLWKSLNDPEFQKWSKKAKRPVTPMDGPATQKALQALMNLYGKKYRELLKKYIK